MRASFLLIVLAAALLLAAPAWAQSPGALAPEFAPAPEVTYETSITISPVHLALGFVEITSEFRASPEMAGAVILGFGRIGPVSIFEIGGQFLYYPFGSFDHGMQLGAEMAYLGGGFEEGEVSAVAAGLTLGPFVGYKIAADIGFTFNIQFGYQKMFLAAKAEAGSDSATATAEDAGPLLNLNFGWSF